MSVLGGTFRTGGLVSATRFLMCLVLGVYWSSACVDGGERTPAEPSSDADGDGIMGADDNCPEIANESQVDDNENGLGDDCEFVQLAAGDTYTCVLAEAGSVSCWGTLDCADPDYDGLLMQAVAPMAIANLDEVTAITAGSNHACALRRNGSVVCWGFNHAGELGHGGSLDSSATPVSVVGIDDATAIDAKGRRTCVLHASGAVSCWGLVGVDSSGIDPITISQDTPELVPEIDNAVDVAVGGMHACAVLATGSVRCWGTNSYGELGNGSAMNSETPVTVDGLEDAVAVVAGPGRTCALRQNNTVACWGSGGLGDGSGAASSSPVEVVGLDEVTGLASYGTTCALLSDGTVSCWGRNDYGELGDGSFTVRNSPTQVSEVDEATAIAVGEMHACAIRNGGTQIACWGSDAEGQLGRGRRLDMSTTPSAVSGLDDVTSVFAGSGATCALRRNGSAVCWGCLAWEEPGCGLGSTPTRLAAADDSTALDVGWHEWCALQESGSVTCWRSEITIVDGDVVIDNSNEPAPVPALSDATSIAVGGGTDCALRKNGSVVCWGDGANGSLGNGTSDESTSTPVQVTGITGATAVAAGGSNCALRQNGSVACWGSNSVGQLGDGTMDTRNTPVRVSGLTDAVQINVGEEFACALLETGSVSCWGFGNQGQLGDGSFAMSTAPVAVSGLSDTVQLSAGRRHVCALRENGSVVCWGANTKGALGDGTMTDRATPVQVSGLSDVIAVSAGDGHSCALRSGGSVVCWGDNTTGQLGNGESWIARAAEAVVWR